MSAALYKGRVTHRRLKPVDHRLSYRVFSMLIDLDRLDEMDARFKWFSRGRFNLFSFYDSDYGLDIEADKPRNLADHIRAALVEAGQSADSGSRIQLLCYPRMLGYAFNPIAVYYCYDPNQRLQVVLYQVSSTFGERHTYLIPVDSDDDVIRQEAAKRLHVSPFMDMDMRYDFRLGRPNQEEGSSLSVIIDQSDRHGRILNAAFSGLRETVTDRALLRAFFAYPLMTVKIVAGIHFEAVKLLLKGLPLLKGPKAPKTPVSVPPQRSCKRSERVT